ncbi:MAG: VWA domain-containing protein [Acidobacteriia bacterium]|nr:VWA domain-containing protein [Terriglobia bacterium]
MGTRAICTTLLALLMPACGYGQSGGSGSQQPAGTQQGDITIRKNVNLVNVYFSVKDRHGALVPNLSKDTFEVFENGKPQTIKYFAAETDLPLTLGLMIDSSGSMMRMLPEEKVVGADFLRQVIGEKDLAYILSFDISVDLLQDLTSDMRLLRAGLDKARINVGGGSSGIPGLGQGPVPISHPKGTLLFDAVYLSAHDVMSQQVGRKAMVILTDGEDFGSRLKLKDAIEAAQKADTICYVLLLSDPQYGANSRDMGQLAEQTGGHLISIQRPDKIGEAFHQISAELRSQYSLGYSPDDERRDGSFRKIEIKSKDGHKVQARKGYYAPAN